MASCEKDGIPHHEIGEDLLPTHILSLNSKKIPYTKAEHYKQLENKINILKEEFRTNFNKQEGDKDSIWIVTKNVTYITYAKTHTYTFKLRRKSPEYLIENIVLHYNVKEKNYDEYLVQYDVTPGEYLVLYENGLFEDSEKVIVTKLNNGFFNSLGIKGCELSSETAYVDCAWGEHTQDNISSWGSCEGAGTENGPSAYQVTSSSCTDDPDPDPESIDSGDSGGGGGGTSNDDVVTNPDLTEPCSDDSTDNQLSNSDGDCLVLDTDPVEEERAENFIIEITETLAFQNKTALKKIKDDLVRTGELGHIINKFKPRNPVLHLEWGIFYNTNWRNTGRTILNEDINTAFIDINENSLDKVSNIVMVKTIAHEIIHAELYRKLKELVDEASVISFSEYEGLLTNYPGIAHYVMAYGELNVNQNGNRVITWGLTPNYSLAHHNQMAEFYRETLIKTMKDYDLMHNITRGLNSIEFYEAISWAGLKNYSESGINQYYDAWQKFKDTIDINESHIPLGQRTYDRYENIIINEYNNSGIIFN